MPDHAHRVVAACAVCEGHMKPCNIFTREVAHCLGVALPGGYGDADEILTYLDMHWRRLSLSRRYSLLERVYLSLQV
jgi:hypothetical protein